MELQPLLNNLEIMELFITRKNLEKMNIKNLCFIYQYLIQNKNEDAIEFSDELLLINNYIYIIKNIHEDKHKFKFDKVTNYENKFIPPASLLEILNIILKHFNRKKCLINLEINDKWVTIKVQNLLEQRSLINLESELKNLNLRYKLLTDRKIKFENKRLESQISIPLTELVT